MPSEIQKLRVSMAHEGDVNNECHTHREDVKPHDRRITPHPKVAVILWGNFFVNHPDAEVTVRQLVTALVEGRFMNGLAQYGVGRGTMLDVTTIGTDALDPAPATLSSGEAQDQLIRWLRTEF